MTRVACIDIGRKNFAFYVEELGEYDDLSRQFYALPKKQQRRIRGEMNDDVEAIQQELFTRASRVDMCVADLTEGEETNDLTANVRRNLYTFLHQRKDLWDSCECVFIEEQYYNPYAQNKAGINKDAILLGETCFAYFVFFHPNVKVEYFKSSLKTQTLGCEDYITKVDKKTGLRESKKMTKYDRKKWSVEKAREIFTLRDDVDAVEQLANKKQKQDDVSDCVIMCQAYVFKAYVLKM